MIFSVGLSFVDHPRFVLFSYIYFNLRKNIDLSIFHLRVSLYLSLSLTH